MEAIFSLNSKIKRAVYNAVDQVLKVTFVKKTGLEQRAYAAVPKEIGCKFLYQKATKDVMSYYSNNIRGKFKVQQVTTPLF